MKDACTTDKVKRCIRKWQIKHRALFKSQIRDSDRPFARVGQPAFGDVAANNFSCTVQSHRNGVPAAAATSVQASLPVEPIEVEPVGTETFRKKFYGVSVLRVIKPAPQRPKQLSGNLFVR